MKRFHVHVSVDDLAASIRFYSSVFGAPPGVEKPDYAKWMIEDPRINFAISRRGATTGIDHLGIQVDSADELAELRERTRAAEIAAVDQPDAACCYARSDKYWTVDPQGVAWETYHSLEAIPLFGDAGRETPEEPATEEAVACRTARPAAAAIAAAPVTNTCCG